MRHEGCVENHVRRLLILLAVIIGLMVLGELRLSRGEPYRGPARGSGGKCADYKLVGPVSGAVVSTSVDGTTATTDATGHFHLLTKNPVFSDEFYEVKVRAGEVVVDDNFGLSPTSRLTFVLSPPELILAGRDWKSGQCSVTPFHPDGLARSFS
jgi:hypothetical protein